MQRICLKSSDNWRIIKSLLGSLRKWRLCAYLIPRPHHPRHCLLGKQLIILTLLSLTTYHLFVLLNFFFLQDEKTTFSLEEKKVDTVSSKALQTLRHFVPSFVSLCMMEAEFQILIFTEMVFINLVYRIFHGQQFWNKTLSSQL